MLPRILEPEVMDSADEALDYDAMDHREVNRRFVDDFLAVWNRANPILDVGTGTAQIPIELCRQVPSAQIIGIDLAESMLCVGRKNIQQAGFETAIRLEHQDAKNLPYQDESIAAVISNSIVHHIPEPARVLREMVRVCQVGGTLFVRDLMRPAESKHLEHLVATYAQGANERQRAMFAASLHAALTLDEMRQIIADLGYDPMTVTVSSDRHWTWTAVRQPMRRHIVA
jgi:ubiquinone/menaquinone biosynthesis C-methylase UbiE